MKRLSLAKPHLIIVVGIPGSGKSYFAEKFASTFGAPYVCEAQIEALAPESNTSALALLQLDELLKTRQSIIFDGTSNTRAERGVLSKKARDAGYSPLYVWVQTDQATAKARAVGKKTLASSDYDKAEKRFIPPSTTEKPLVISGKHTYASQAKVVLKKLSSPRAEVVTQPSPAATRPEPAKPRNIFIR